MGLLCTGAFWITGHKDSLADVMELPIGKAMLITFVVIAGSIPFVAARRRNGFRGLHDLATGTRVVQTTHSMMNLRKFTGFLDPKREDASDLTDRVAQPLS